MLQHAVAFQPLMQRHRMDKHQVAAYGTVLVNPMQRRMQLLSLAAHLIHK